MACLLKLDIFTFFVLFSTGLREKVQGMMSLFMLFSRGIFSGLMVLFLYFLFMLLFLFI